MGKKIHSFTPEFVVNLNLCHYILLTGYLGKFPKISCNYYMKEEKNQIFLGADK